MRVSRFTLGLSVAVMLLLGSCTTPKDIAYFPELETGSIVQAEQMLEIKLRPEDKITIVVSSSNPTLASMFNLMTVQNRVGGTTSNTRTVGNASSGSSQVAYYTIDSKGDIDFPVLGKIHVAGLTREQVAQKIANILIESSQLKDPIVTVEFANTGISILGEVSSPGRYEFNKDHLTIIDAIAMAGDLKINGMRNNILVMRNMGDGKMEAYRVNLLNAQELASSPVFYMQQDDVIYVEPNDKAKRETTPNGNSPYTASFWVSMGSFALTIVTLVITLTR
ncbi:MAG: polysaccharide biosynthesis/export family protein [Muribaculaceae bacterium]|nr:polysaccharide biosynthesis/export family protein [Muribaculaceae bacterium]